MLINQIKSDSLEARKARQTDTATLLTTLYSEASMIGKMIIKKGLAKLTLGNIYD